MYMITQLIHDNVLVNEDDEWIEDDPDVVGDVDEEEEEEKDEDEDMEDEEEEEEKDEDMEDEDDL